MTGHCRIWNPTTMNDTMTLARQMQLLLEHTHDPSGQPITASELARAIGLAEQTLLNIVHGIIDNPRLHTVRAVCVFYRISLDYFDLQTEEQCRQYLAARHLKLASPLLQQIHVESTSLIGKARDNILSMLSWIGIGHSPKLS